MWLRGTFRLCDVWLILASLLGGKDHSVTLAVTFLLMVSRCAVPVIVTSPLSCCCKTSQVKNGTSSKNSLRLKIKGFRTPREGPRPLPASLARGMKCYCITFTGLLPTGDGEGPPRR